MKELSCGFIVVNAKDSRQVLACLPYGRSQNRPGNYDIPKGHREDGESTLDAAMRELREETGLVLDNEKIYDCGLFKYLPQKDLYVYLVFVDLDIHTLYCDSKFENTQGKMVNEIVGYKWTDDVSLFYKSLQPIIETCLEHFHNGYYDLE